MSKQEKINDLKENLVAFGLLPKCYQDILDFAGKKNCIYFGAEGWTDLSDITSPFLQEFTYRLRENYTEADYADESKANLMNAAPEMYEALKFAKAQIKKNTPKKALPIIRDAISRVERIGE